MKRAFAVLLAVLMLSALAGCGTGDEAVTNPADDPSNVGTTVGDTPESKISEETTAEPDVDPLSVAITVEEITNTSDDPLIVDLTSGDYCDWAHFGLENAAAVNCKVGADQRIIGSPAAIQSGGLEMASSDDLTNYRLKFVWGDGNPTGSGSTKSFVKNGQEGIKLDFDMPAGSYDLTLYASTYNELADVIVYDEASNELARASLGDSFSEWMHMPKIITVHYYCDYAQKISVHIARTTYDATQWPGLSLGAAAVKEVNTRMSEIKLSVSSGGTVDGTGTYEVGEAVTLTAKPNDGYSFKEWKVISGNVTLSDKKSNPVTFTAPVGGAGIKAIFVNESGQQELTDYIDVRLGSTGASHTLIGTQRPNASVNPGPDTEPMNNCTGYEATGKIRGFSQMHVSGTGVGKYGQVLLSPQIGLATRLDGHDSDKSNENPTAAEYSVTLDRYGIDVSFTPAEHATIYKFTYPKSDDANIVIDMAHNICNENATNVKLDIGTDSKGNTFISGSGFYPGGWAGAHNVYFYAVVNKTPKTTGVYDANGAKPGVNTIGPVNVSNRLAGLGGYMTFDTEENETIMMKVGMSFKSVEQAKKWLEDEIPEWDYEEVKAETNRQWNDELNKIVIDGNVSENDKIKFYTAIYHAHIMPRDRSGDFAHYDSDMIDDHFAGWDTWRTLYPLYAITNPDIVTKTVNSFITRYNAQGYVKDSMCAGIDMNEQQGGDDVDNIIADAYAKGIPGVDWNEAYKIVKNHADNYRLDNLGWGTQNQIPNPNSSYKTLGWIPSDNGRQSRILSCSYQLEYAYNDYVAALMAKDLGTKEDYEKYLARSNSWTNIWREDVSNNGYSGFIWPKNEDGSWTVPPENLEFTLTKDMASWNEYFYEASSWNYSFFVPHDVPQLIEKMGGNDTFISRLDLGIRKGWVDYGNEPAFLATYLFNYTDKPYMTTDAVALQRAKFTLTGVPGNDDSGAMSSWYIFSSIGFFPNAGQNLYYFTSPCYDKTVISLDNGKTFTITANNLSAENKYIQSITLNGKPCKSTMFKHEDIINGGELVFEMGSTPVDYTK